MQGASQWARDSLALHAADKREFVYTRCVCVRAQAATANRQLTARVSPLPAAQRAAGGGRHARPAVERGAAGAGARRQDARLHAHVRAAAARCMRGTAADARTHAGTGPRRHACRTRTRSCASAAALTRRALLSDPGVDGEPRGCAGGRNLPQRPLLAGRAGPERLRRLHVVHRRHPRHGLGGAPRVRQDPVHELRRLVRAARSEACTRGRADATRSPAASASLTSRRTSRASAWRCGASRAQRRLPRRRERLDSFCFFSHALHDACMLARVHTASS